MKNTKKWIIITLIIGIGLGIVYVTSYPTKTKLDVPVILEIPTGVKTITPEKETSDIDAVSYETLLAERITDEQILTHVLIEGVEENIPNFVIPYTDFIKKLNPGVNNVVVKMYRSKEDQEQNNPAWQYANGLFAPIQHKEQP